MSETTEHGQNIANQIPDEDAYGYYAELTLADVWNIIDNIHTHFMDTGRDTGLFEKWMRDLEELDEGCPTI